ncbi:hypothetical protein QE152_g27801 [Popillia japonica]|uniref:Uncharacterized protein n=1 Tax=Popillia japonica TaxID=7064 RepID=A0AAW1JL66_POPJA
MKNKSKLKEYTEEKVYINDDMTKEEREIQEKIRIRKAKEERMKGKTRRKEKYKKRYEERPKKRELKEKLLR